MWDSSNTSDLFPLNLTNGIFNFSDDTDLHYDLELTNVSTNGSVLNDYDYDYQFEYTMKDTERQILGLVSGAVGMVGLLSFDSTSMVGL